MSQTPSLCFWHSSSNRCHNWLSQRFCSVLPTLLVTWPVPQAVSQLTVVVDWCWNGSKFVADYSQCIKLCSHAGTGSTKVAGIMMLLLRNLSECGWCFCLCFFPSKGAFIYTFKRLELCVWTDWFLILATSSWSIWNIVAHWTQTASYRHQKMRKKMGQKDREGTDSIRLTEYFGRQMCGEPSSAHW